MRAGLNAFDADRVLASASAASKTSPLPGRRRSTQTACGPVVQDNVYMTTPVSKGCIYATTDCCTWCQQRAILRAIQSEASAVYAYALFSEHTLHRGITSNTLSLAKRVALDVM
jgi:hypothetical protein